MTYLAPFAVFLMVLFPILLPAAITGFHTVIDWRRNAQATA
ncbi:hypothetical protein [Mycobacterium hubeiense]|nr:hypothetical protein [Mycobacterium sp. QGD 101]